MRLKVHPNAVTFLGIIFAFLASYYFAQHYYLFAIFILLHFLADSLDGTLARATKKENVFGEYFDLIADRLAEFFLLIAIYFVLLDYYVIIILGLFILVQLVFFSCKTKTPMVFSRTWLGITLFLIPPVTSLVPFILSYKLALTLTYLVHGSFSLYIIILQIQYLLGRKI